MLCPSPADHKKRIDFNRILGLVMDTVPTRIGQSPGREVYLRRHWSSQGPAANRYVNPSESFPFVWLRVQSSGSAEEASLQSLSNYRWQHPVYPPLPTSMWPPQTEPRGLVALRMIFSKRSSLSSASSPCFSWSSAGHGIAGDVDPPKRRMFSTWARAKSQAARDPGNASKFRQ